MIFCLQNAWKENFAKKQESHKRGLVHFYIAISEKVVKNQEVQKKIAKRYQIKMNGRMNDWQKQFSLKFLCGMIKKIISENVAALL